MAGAGRGDALSGGAPQSVPAIRLSSGTSRTRIRLYPVSMTRCSRSDRNTLCTLGSEAPTSAASSGWVRDTPIEIPTSQGRPYTRVSSPSTRATRVPTAQLPNSCRRRVAQRSFAATARITA